MRIAIFGRSVNEQRKQVFQTLFDHLMLHQSEAVFYAPFYKIVRSILPQNLKFHVYETPEDLFGQNCKCMISVGGDGTLLEAVTHIKNSQLPVMGINTGRLGFLSGFSADEAETAIKLAVNGNYIIKKRSLVGIEAEGNPFNDFPFALNEVTFHKKENSTMITVKVSINGAYLNSYWADGLIISTPTGSTGYSLSCGGPILMPESPSFVITPIAPHNLNVRPLVIDDSAELIIESAVRGKNLLLSMDSRSLSYPASRKILVKKAPFLLNLISGPERGFLSTLREKLMWGIDKRN